MSQRRVQSSIEAVVADEALRGSPATTPQVQELGREVGRDAIDRVAVEHRRSLRESPLARLLQGANYLFGILYALISLEIVLELLGARDGNTFKRGLDVVTGPFLAPFRTLLPMTRNGGSELITGYLVALGIYALLHLAVYKLLTMLARPRTSV